MSQAHFMIAAVPITWNISLVVLSVLMAIIGSFTALTHVQRMKENKGRMATVWMLVGGSTLGMAIWSMHFVGMLAVHLNVLVAYDPVLTLLSLVPAVIAAMLCFLVLRRETIDLSVILPSGLIMGAGISAMHYIGMAAIRMAPAITYDTGIVVLSIVVAIVASWGALFLMYNERWLTSSILLRMLLSAVMMGLAISSMHYIAMLGVHFPENGLCLTNSLLIEPDILATMIGSSTLVWFGGGLLASLFDQRMARKNTQEMFELERAHRELQARSDKASQAMIAALRESEERLSMTLQNAPDAVFITERDGHIVYVNDNVIELLGYNRNELYAMTVFDLVPAEWREAYISGSKQIIATAKRHVFEIRLVTKNGIKIPMELNAVLLPNGRVYGSCRDIRERKSVQKALKDSQDNLQRMMDSMTEGMYGVDTQGNCTFVNAAFLRILGFKHADEVLGKVIHDLIHHTRPDGTPYPAQECLMYQAFRMNQHAHTDKEVFWRKDGIAVPVEYWSHPIFKDNKVVGAVATFIDITERIEKERHIHQLAFYDALTQLPNRRLLVERAQQSLVISSRTGRYGALMLLDLDDFKKLNDSRGHDIGDLLLQEVANRLLLMMRKGDTVARLGGDEFVVILEALSEVAEEAANQAEMVAGKISDALNQPYLLAGTRHQISSSVGVVLFKGYEESTEALFKYADIAMYQAKHAGRNTIRFYDPAMQAAIENRTALEADLLNAIEQKQFRLYYQVQVDANGKPLAAEVLIRWHHPQKGLIFPDQFIPLCEEIGLIVPIGSWVLNEACEQIRLWKDAPLFCNLSLAVNVSARQFRQPDFVELVQNAVASHGIQATSLKLELTESLVLENLGDTIDKMKALKEFGVNFAMDDFGTGYSSLSHLKQLPLTQIKIDKSFVRDIATDRGDKVMVMTIVDLCMNFEVDVIAEGVETEEQFKLLHRYGCGSFQGFLFSNPVPIDEFEQQIREQYR